MIAETPRPPYYAVIFTSIRSEGDKGYALMSAKMIALAQTQEGFLGIESAREETGITISYWRDLESIKRWKENTEHALARSLGRSQWYQTFKVRIVKVEHDYEFNKTRSGQ